MNFLRSVRNRLFLGCIAAGILSFGLQLSAVAQTDPRFERLPEGLLDRETGLVWGYHLWMVDNLLTDGRPTSRSWDFTMTLQVRKWTDFNEDGIEDEGEMSLIPYAEFSNEYFGPDPEGTEWRAASVEEWQAALGAGLIEHMDYDPHPNVTGFLTDFLLKDQTEWPFWPYLYTGTFAGKKRGGGNSGYIIDIRTGELTTLNGYQGTIPVRAPVPTGNGKGGKGK